MRFFQNHKSEKMMKKKIISFCLFLLVFFRLNGADLDSHRCVYLEPKFLKQINKKNVKIIVNLGAFIGLDAVQLHLHYEKPVYAFECDPYYFNNIFENAQDYPGVVLVPYGVWDKSALMDFYHANDQGVSSFYEINPSSVLRAKTVRLDEWMNEAKIEAIDLLCIDIQGATLNALMSLGDRIKDVRYIIAQVDFSPVCKNEPSFDKICSFLKKNGFKCVVKNKKNFNFVMFKS